MNLRWEFAEPRPVCGVMRGPRSTTRCELPPDHMVGGVHSPRVREVNHTGRSYTGRWFSWPPVEPVPDNGGET